MDITVGSTNPVKVAAVERALERYEPTVSAVDVDSGVAEQPRSIAETIEGAETRARRALDAGGGAYGVGLEGGITSLEGVSGVYLIMWAAVTDGERMGRGGGPSFELPPAVANRLEAGGELGPIMNDYLGVTDIAVTEGAAGALTDGLTDRTTALTDAVAAAFGPFVTTHYDGSDDSH